MAVGANDWDIEHWQRLAAGDPAVFEAERARYIADFIARAPCERRQRLERLQWRIDQVRRRSGTPMAACLRIYGMMWDSVLEPDGLLDQLQGRKRPSPRRRPAAAVVVPLRRS